MATWRRRRAAASSSCGSASTPGIVTGPRRSARPPRSFPRACASSRAPGTAPPAGGRLLYLDTETTGLAGGTGTYVFLVGAGFFDGDTFEVRQYFMRDLDEEPALLAAVGGLLGQFDGVVTYNGGGFDLPLLETRFVLARRRFPADVFHLDLLGSARRLWSTRLADCRLGTLERHVLGFTREDDLPGALIPSAYFDYLRRKQPGALPRIFEHNRHDILSLAALTGWVTGAVARAPVPDLHPEELAGLGRIWEATDVDRGLACYRMALERGPGKPGTGARPPPAGRRREAPRPLGRGPRLLGGGHQRRSMVRPAAVGGDRQGP